MKKIIIISYFFPPSSKAGAHRAYAMAEFLPKFGWYPIFIAPEKGYYGRIPRFDPKLLNLVSKFPIYRIPFFYPFNNTSTSFAARATRRIWESTLFPDGRVLWNKGIKKEIEFIIKKHKPNAFFITSAPFSSFLLSPYLKNKFGLPVILDYRDPWSGNLYTISNKWKAKFAFSIEKKILASADLVTAASYYIADFIKNLFVKYVKNTEFFGFPYGYNGEFFRKEILTTSKNRLSDRAPAAFAGQVHGDIDVEVVLKGIKLATQNRKDISSNLRIRCYGSLFGCFNKKRYLIKKYGLENNVSLHPFVPYREFLEILNSSSFLILPHGDSRIAKLLYPTKLFDYLGVRRPILYIGGEGQVWETISACNAGICSPPEQNKIAKFIIKVFKECDSKSWYNQLENYEKLDRFNIYVDFCKKLNDLI